jgi:hypothetical protein
MPRQIKYARITLFIFINSPTLDCLIGNGRSMVGALWILAIKALEGLDTDAAIDGDAQRLSARRAQPDHSNTNYNMPTHRANCQVRGAAIN